MQYTEPKYSRFRSTTMQGESHPAWQEDYDFLDIYQDIADLTLVSPARLFQIYQYVRYANFLPGNFAQVGVYRGGSALLIASIIKKEKSFYLFDTFGGLPKGNSRYDVLPAGSFSDTSINDINKLFINHHNVSAYPGLFPDTLTDDHKKNKYAFVYLDVDLYQSNQDALEFFYFKLVSGGVIIMDDFGSRNTPGILQSTNEFVATHKLPPPIISTKYQAVMIKP